MQFLDDLRLYTDTTRCLNFFESPYAGEVGAAAAPIPVHFFWSGSLNEKHLVCLKSFLATQRPGHFRPILWTDNIPPRFELGELARFIEVQPFDIQSAAEGTPLAGHPALGTVNATTRSDFFRLLILNRFGGLYADLDFLFLRDLFEFEPFASGAEFTYAWSNRAYCNNAFMFLRRGGSTVAELIRRSAQDGPVPWKVTRFDDSPEALDLLVLPCALFDPLWLVHDGVDQHFRPPFSKFDGFFRKFGFFHRRRGVTRCGDLFGSAFAYHWHNRWNAPVVADSFFGICAAEVDRRFAEVMRIVDAA